MKDYTFKLRGHSVKEISVEAESETEAREKLNNREWANETELSFEEMSGELISVKEWE